MRILNHKPIIVTTDDAIIVKRTPFFSILQLVATAKNKYPNQVPPYIIFIYQRLISYDSAASVAIGANVTLYVEFADANRRNTKTTTHL